MNLQNAYFVQMYTQQKRPHYSAGMMCSSQQHRHNSANRHQLLRTLPTTLVTPISAKRSHGHYILAGSRHYSTGSPITAGP